METNSFTKIAIERTLFHILDQAKGFQQFSLFTDPGDPVSMLESKGHQPSQNVDLLL
jgi:hypothetical protein